MPQAGRRSHLRHAAGLPLGPLHLCDREGPERLHGKAGTTDAARWYFSSPVFAFSFWPLPLVRLFYGYGGDFQVAQTPVTFQEDYGKSVTKGTDLLIFH